MVEGYLSTYTFDWFTFELPRRYEPIKRLDIGTDEMIVVAIDHSTNMKVAIQKFQKCEDIESAQKVLRNLIARKNLHHENILSLKNAILTPNSAELLGDIYIVTEYMETNLDRIIKSMQALSTNHIGYLIYQILKALKFMHSVNIIHRDLKPQNLFLNENCNLRLHNFERIQSLNISLIEDLHGCSEIFFYKSPEILLGQKESSRAEDMWSVGCIFAEVMNRKKMFPGSNHVEQIKVICNLRGTPDEKTKELFSGLEAYTIIEELPPKQKEPLQDLFPKQPVEALDLLDKMLDLNPTTRISVEEALEHPYLQQYHNAEDEPLFQGDVDFSFENDSSLTLEGIQALILDEIQTLIERNSDQNDS